MTPKTIVFVCTGNICRSAMAEAMMKHFLMKDKITGIEVFSRGIGVWEPQPIDEEARKALKAIDIDPGPHESKVLDENDVIKADRIYAMTYHQCRVILTNYPDSKDKVHLLAKEEIDDPIGGSPKDFEKCRIDIQQALITLLPELKSERTPP